MEPKRFVEPEDARSYISGVTAYPTPTPDQFRELFARWGLPPDATLVELDTAFVISLAPNFDPSRPRGLPAGDDDVRPDFVRGEG